MLDYMVVHLMNVIFMDWSTVFTRRIPDWILWWCPSFYCTQEWVSPSSLTDPHTSGVRNQGTWTFPWGGHVRKLDISICLPCFLVPPLSLSLSLSLSLPPSFHPFIFSTSYFTNLFIPHNSLCCSLRVTVLTKLRFPCCMLWFHLSAIPIW